jgi:hypothetical protein
MQVVCTNQPSPDKDEILTSKKAYPLRVNSQVLAAMQRWADDELRSVNAQIEFVLRDALVKSGRVKIVQKVVTEVLDIEPKKDGGR